MLCRHLDSTSSRGSAGSLRGFAIKFGIAFPTRRRKGGESEEHQDGGEKAEACPHQGVQKGMVTPPHGEPQQKNIKSIAGCRTRSGPRGRSRGFRPVKPDQRRAGRERQAGARSVVSAGNGAGRLNRRPQAAVPVLLGGRQPTARVMGKRLLELDGTAGKIIDRPGTGRERGQRKQRQRDEDQETGKTVHGGRIWRMRVLRNGRGLQERSPPQGIKKRLTYGSTLGARQEVVRSKASVLPPQATSRVSKASRYPPCSIPGELVGMTGTARLRAAGRWRSNRRMSAARHMAFDEIASGHGGMAGPQGVRNAQPPGDGGDIVPLDHPDIEAACTKVVDPCAAAAAQGRPVDNQRRPRRPCAGRRGNQGQSPGEHRPAVDHCPNSPAAVAAGGVRRLPNRPLHTSLSPPRLASAIAAAGPI